MFQQKLQAKAGAPGTGGAGSPDQASALPGRPRPPAPPRATFLQCRAGASNFPRRLRAHRRGANRGLGQAPCHCLSPPVPVPRLPSLPTLAPSSPSLHTLSPLPDLCPMPSARHSSLSTELTPPPAEAGTSLLPTLSPPRSPRQTGSRCQFPPSAPRCALWGAGKEEESEIILVSLREA